MLAGQFGVTVLGLAALRVVTEILDPVVYGTVALILAGLGLGKGMFLAPWLAAQLRFHPDARRSGGLRSLYGAVSGMCALGVLLAATVVSLGLGLTVAGLRGIGAPILLAVAGVWLAADGGISLVLNYLNAELRQGLLAAVRVTDAFLRPAVAIVAVVLLAGGAVLFVAGQAAGALLLVTFAAAILLRSRGTKGKREAAPSGRSRWRGRILRYGMPLVPMAILQWAIHLGDRYILEFFHGSQEVGLYSAAYGLASQPFLMLSGVATLLIRPRLFESIGEDSKSALRYRRVWLGTLLLVGGMGLVLLIILHQWIARILLAEEYRTAAGLIPIIGAAYLMLAMGQGLENWAMAENRTRRILAAGIVSMLVSIGSALLLIPRFGSDGAAWATLLGLGSYAGAILVAESASHIGAKRMAK
ncbi:MAG: oligosaccharide flippase family protein [Gemmatimonadota bacterium]